MTDFADVTLLTQDRLDDLMLRDLGQSIKGGVPVWNGTSWSFIPAGANTDALTSDTSAPLKLSYKTPAASASPIPNDFVDKGFLTLSPNWIPTPGYLEIQPRTKMRSETAFSLTSGELKVFGGIVLSRGRAVNSISFLSSGAAVTPTHWWFCLIDQAGNILGKTADQLTATWAVDTVKTLALTAQYTPSVDTAVYLGVCMVAATPATLRGQSTSAILTALTPIMNGVAGTGLTTPSSITSPVTVTGAHASIVMGWIS